MNLSGVVNIFVMVIVICGIRNTIYRPRKTLSFVAYRVNSKILGIGSEKRSWGDVKEINSVKRSGLGSDISENLCIL